MCNVSRFMQGSVSRSTANMGDRFDIVLVCYKKSYVDSVCQQVTDYFAIVPQIICLRELKFNPCI